MGWAFLYVVPSLSLLWHHREPSAHWEMSLESFTIQPHFPLLISKYSDILSASSSPHVLKQHLQEGCDLLFERFYWCFFGDALRTFWLRLLCFLSNCIVQQVSAICLISPWFDACPLQLGAVPVGPRGSWTYQPFLWIWVVSGQEWCTPWLLGCAPQGAVQTQLWLSPLHTLSAQRSCFIYLPSSVTEQLHNPCNWSLRAEISPAFVSVVVVHKEQGFNSW